MSLVNLPPQTGNQALVARMLPLKPGQLLPQYGHLLVRLLKFIDVLLDNSLVLDVDGLGLSRSLDQALRDEDGVVFMPDDQGLQVVELIHADWVQFYLVAPDCLLELSKTAVELLDQDVLLG